jgi:hypothetical protein
MPRMRFEPTTSAIERAKTVHSLDSEATVIGKWDSTVSFCILSNSSFVPTISGVEKHAIKETKKHHTSL